MLQMKNQNKGVFIMLEELKDFNEFITVENHKGLKLVLSTVGAGVYKIYYKQIDIKQNFLFSIIKITSKRRFLCKFQKYQIIKTVFRVFR